MQQNTFTANVKRINIKPEQTTADTKPNEDKGNFSFRQEAENVEKNSSPPDKMSSEQEWSKY